MSLLAPATFRHRPEILVQFFGFLKLAVEREYRPRGITEVFPIQMNLSRQPNIGEKAHNKWNIPVYSTLFAKFYQGVNPIRLPGFRPHEAHDLLEMVLSRPHEVGNG